ncbi:hypothetical protein C6Y39_12475 [Alteromonas gracilis]|uniref:Right handed beta helix domain-containing protein n=2 Tax=Alteromonas gracilis TaxID=1479524 RepID=A0ABX5CPS3_9ALTE|nr:hypothetical protein C6Y39_12475 [Alteromonas gracilis]
MFRFQHVLIFIIFSLFYSEVINASTIDNVKNECLVKDVSSYQWGVRHVANLPADLELKPGAIIEKCFTVKGVGKHPLILNAKGISISVNGSVPVSDQPLEIQEGDTLRVRVQVYNKYNSTLTHRLTFEETDSQRRRKIYRIIWNSQTVNTPRKPKTWYLGPSRQHRQLKEILHQLVAGDTVYLDPNAVYEPVEIKNISGTKELPIRLIGNTKDAGSRPIFAGGTERFNWTLALRNSHNWRIDNIILQDGGLCFRNEATNTELKNVVVRRCSTGVLSTDLNSGNFTMSNVEVTESGGKKNGRPWGHAVYVASDQHAFPGSVFVLKNSYLHGNRGNIVKSRFENSLIQNNWIESGSDRQAKYLLELIGYDQKYDFAGQQFEVKNNIIFMRPPGLGSRVGGDGNSGSRGDVLFENNLFLIDKGFERTILRTFQGIRSITLRNNSVAFVGSYSKLLWLTDEISDSNWVEGRPHITFENNVTTEDSILLKRDEVTTSDDRSFVIVHDSLELAPIITSIENIQKLRPQKGEYIEIASF